MRIMISAAGALCAAAAASSWAAEPITAGAADMQTQMNAVAEALQSVGPVEQAIRSYRLSHDGFPASNAEAGLVPPSLFASNSVKTLAIGPDGIIDVTLTAASGIDGGVVRFHPEFAPQSGGGDVHWTCASASYANIGDLTGGTCEHTQLP
ncbi:MAG TPA: pilin [Rudaea sp.]|jgi:hypothetical protein